MKWFIRGSLFIALIWLATNSYAALTPGGQYTVSVYPINSNGTVGALATSTAAVADASGNISFSLSNVPTVSDGYNFLQIVVTDSAGTLQRRSLAPAPSQGSTTNLGVSPMTKAQTEAMLDAMSDAGTDDPIMVLFGFTIVRSGAYNNSVITQLGGLGRAAVRDTGGFNDYLEGKIGTAKMAIFRSAIQGYLGQYTAKIKDAVDNIANTTTSKAYKGQASALLSQLLCDAAADAGFDPGLINAAMDAMKDTAESYMVSVDMGDEVEQSIGAVMGATYQKIRAESMRKKYIQGLNTLNASDTQVTRVSGAITTLSNAMISAFQDFEAIFGEEELAESAEIAAAQTSFNTAMEAAFSSFMGNAASTDAEIDDMVTAMKAGFCGGDGDCETGLDDMKDPNGDDDYSDGMFTFWDMSNNVRNWPTTMVVAVTWVASNYPDTFSYVRDDVEVPDLMEWLDADDDGDITDDSYQKRHDFDDQNTNGVSGDEKNMPTAIAALFGLQEDIDIIKNRRWAGEMASSCDVVQSAFDALSGAEQTAADTNFTTANGKAFDLEKNAVEDSVTIDDTSGRSAASWQLCSEMSPFLLSSERQALENLMITRLAALKDQIGPSGVTDAEKQALIDTVTMPDL